MSVVALVTAALTMTSREISALVDLRHDNVKRTIETLAERGAIALPQSEEVPNDGPGPKTIRVYRVGKRDSYVIVAQLSPEFTARLVDRWQELEAAAAEPALNPASLSRMQLIQLAMDAEKERLALEQKVEVLAPKADALERISAGPGTECISDAAKTLRLRPKDLFTWLSEHGWTYRRGGKWHAMQPKLQAGLLEEAMAPAGTWPDGSMRQEPQVRVTRKGLTLLAELLRAEALA